MIHWPCDHSAMLQCSILFTWHFATIHAEEVAQARFIHMITLQCCDVPFSIHGILQPSMQRR